MNIQKECVILNLLQSCACSTTSPLDTTLTISIATVTWSTSKPTRRKRQSSCLPVSALVVAQENHRSACAGFCGLGSPPPTWLRCRRQSGTPCWERRHQQSSETLPPFRRLECSLRRKLCSCKCTLLSNQRKQYALL